MCTCNNLKNIRVPLSPPYVYTHPLTVTHKNHSATSGEAAISLQHATLSWASDKSQASQQPELTFLR
jgi:hypothetical protein